MGTPVAAAPVEASSFYIFAFPSTALHFMVSKSRKLIKFQTPPINLSARRLNFPGELDCMRRRSNRNTTPMEGFHGIRASAEEDGIRASEEEALVEGEVEGPLSLGGGGIGAVLNNTSKWLAVIVFAAILLWKHDAEAAWAAMGGLLNSMLAVELKKILNHERPISTLRSDPGMPSSHAQSIFFIMTYLNLFMGELFGMNALTAILSTLSFIVGSYFSWLRVFHKLHTLDQIIVGAVIGSTFCILWFWSWDNFVSYSFASSLWVRVVVNTGAVACAFGVLHHIYKTCIADERGKSV